MSTSQAEPRMVLRTLYITRKMDERLRDVAFQRRISKNELIRQYIAEAIEEASSEHHEHAPAGPNENGKPANGVSTTTAALNGANGKRRARIAATESS